jgi:uncharacterized protein (DUF1501 family)
MLISRRTLIAGLGAAIGCSGTSVSFANANTSRRFVVVMLRGGMDGLSAVVPYGDPDLRQWRPDLIPPAPGLDGGMHDLGGFWGLHPRLVRLYELYKTGAVLPIHAVTGPDRSRSHFQAQDSMETGAAIRMESGWLNRVASLVPAAGSGGENAVAIVGTPPLLLRGPAPVATWTPTDRRVPELGFYNRFSEMHAADPLTGAAIAAGLRERGFGDGVLVGQDAAPPPPRNDFAQAAHTAGRLLAANDGPRLAAIDSGGDWDTHHGQAIRLDPAMTILDEALDSLKSGLGDAWTHTVVVVMTEFGRTVRMNGTHGTDHGTAGVAFVMGGPVAGGTVRADWVGLAKARLFENRDLQPTTDIRVIVKGLLASHLGLDGAALAQVFPEIAATPPATSLLRA